MIIEAFHILSHVSQNNHIIICVTRAGLFFLIVGEIANFAAYAFAQAILVTLLGALGIIISAALARTILCEKLNIFGILGCVLCVVGSTAIFLHAPQEREINSVKEVWDLATELGILFMSKCL
ncbi:hypothetical protein SLEP1_g40910 [Rubroshorea leprosula]|uniref:Probable magnesium transporter n=1 Tax=Rubroshorea leprosula TaxID=152421 RepID=A0AAV5L562_9ROSI|nr:hypothetical protein SLEP1_g40910 [Rubroshorea leprosula]